MDEVHRARMLAIAPSADLRAVVLVEGTSDQAAVEELARRRGRDLTTEGISVVPMGGARSIGQFVELFGPLGLDVRLAGLCDAGEEDDFRRGLQRAGLGSDLGRDRIDVPGFFVCEADLEDELIRCLETDAVEQVLEAHGDLRSFRIFQKQPAQHGRTTHQQLRRFMGTRSGRKIHYGRWLVEALDLDRVPRPLDMVLAYV